MLLILKVIAVDPVEFFAELYGWSGVPGSVSRSAPIVGNTGWTGEQRKELDKLRGQINGLVGLLVDKGVISGEGLKVTVAAADDVG